MSILKRLNDTFQQVDQAKTLEIINIIKKARNSEKAAHGMYKLLFKNKKVFIFNQLNSIYKIF